MYSSYFKAWPFGVTPEKHAAIWADRQYLYDELHHLLMNFAQRKRSFIQPLWGYLGAGKTHAIWHFSNLFEKERRLKFIYSKFPIHAKNFYQLYTDGFIPSFDFMEFAKISSILWRHLISDKSDEEEAFFFIREEIASGNDDFAQIVYNIAKMWSISPIKASRDPIFILSRMWLQGAKLGRRHLNSIGVARNISNDSDAIFALGGIINLLTLEGNYNENLFSVPVVWALDDSHVIFARPSKQQEEIQRGIRRMIDECPTKLLILMSFATPDPEKIRQGLIEELKTVASHSIIQIPPLTKEKAAIFILDLINHEKFRRSGVSNQFYPYTEQSLKRIIEYIVEKGIDLLPRNIIRCFEHLTDEAQKERKEIIDIQFVDKFFNEKCSSDYCSLLT